MNRAAARTPPVPRGRPRRRAAASSGEARTAALEAAVEQAVLAASVHGTPPWTLVPGHDRVEVRADRSRQLAAPDPLGRELVRSAGAALFDLRVALSARGWAVAVDRLPRTDDPDLLAVVHAVEGPPDGSLAGYAAAVPRRRTDRRPPTGGPVPEDVLRGPAALAAAEDTVLVPVLREDHRRLVARLTRQADERPDADRAHRHSGTLGEGTPPAAPGDSALVLRATRTGHTLDRLRCGAALQRGLLELTRRGWVAGPVPQADEASLTRTQLRAALTWDAHTQVLLGIGHADDVVAAARRPGHDGAPPVPRRTSAVPAPTGRPPGRRGPRTHRPLSDGHGDTDDHGGAGNPAAPRRQGGGR